MVGVFARQGDALIQIEGVNASEADLLAVLRTVRPVSAGFLAAA